MTTTTYARLRNGEWGLRVQGAIPAPGTTLVVAKRDGSTKQEVVEKVVWSGDGVALCAIARVSAPELDEHTSGVGAMEVCGYTGKRWLNTGGLCPHCGDQC